MKLRVTLGVLVLGVYAALHGVAAVRGFGVQPTGLWLTAAVFSLGDVAAVYGLARRRYWGRILGLGVAVVALTEIAALGILAVFHPAIELPIPLWLGAAQTAPFLVLLGAMLGPRMRAAFDEGPESPWRFESGLARLTRAALVTGIGAVPMLLLMAASSLAGGDDVARAVAAGAGVGLAAALWLVLRAQTVGLPLAAISSVAGAWAAVRVVVSVESCGCGGLGWLSSQTEMAAASLIPGVILGAVVFVAYLPRMIRFVRQ